MQTHLQMREENEYPLKWSRIQCQPEDNSMDVIDKKSDFFFSGAYISFISDGGW